ncbi:phage tail protein [Pseudoalteromonas sp. Of7M-16]|uniref:phage tail protein n=1 Tax=Pseudoalteromonas sp. Of7M-16 TaxID=2917756 RepID=UPI001EF5A631|nr:phage tail protein [Pseudoalteromonas sp. Of7M-16]MCG7551582.1 phage tail protein [Pseudoalteromonas sp. Of7M-16]
MRQMMSLGDFVFSLSEDTPYSGLQRSSGGGWVNVPRYGQKPAKQNTGLQLEKIGLSGTWYRGDGMVNLDTLRAMQARREPLVLTDGYGRNLGLWTLQQLQEKQGRIIDDGTAIVIDFTIELEEYAGDGNTQS